jgi:phosphohistidine phosphatase SixA
MQPRNALLAWVMAALASLPPISLAAPFGIPSLIPEAYPKFVEKPITPELLRAIRQGGFVLYMRHGLTDNSRPDRPSGIDLADCNTQRPLSDAGRVEMKRIGQALRHAGIPLGQILVSPMCRARESAQLAIGDRYTLVEPLMYSANMTREEKKPRIEALRKLLRAPVDKGSNTLLVAHAPNLDDLIGYFVKPEGTLVVFGQSGPDGYEYLASIHPDDWNRLK